MRRLVFLLFLGCGSSAGRDGAVVDSPVSDGQPDSIMSVDAALTTCGYMEAGTCGTGSCNCCPGGGPTQRCLCTSNCNTDTDCTDSTRPHCEHDPSYPNSLGFCTPTQFGCCWLCA